MNLFRRFFPWGPALGSAPMKTLYDLLGARPDDDAEALKKAFRKAAKAHHPDLHASDPDAPLRFRRIVAAHAILRDAKQRASYDRLLQFKRKQLQAKKRTRTIISNAIAAAVVGVLAIGYEFLAPLPTAAVETVVADMHSGNASAANKQDRFIVTAAAVKADFDKAGTPAETAAPRPAARIVTTDRDEPRDAHEGAEVRDGAIVQSAAPSATNNGDAEVITNHRPALALLSDVAKFHREQGIALYRSGDFHRAIAALDRAIRLDPNDAQAHGIRANALDEIGAFERALAGYDQATRSPRDSPGMFDDRHAHVGVAATKRHPATLTRLSQVEHHFGRLRPAGRPHRVDVCRCEKNFHAVMAPRWTAKKLYASHISQRMLHRQLLRTGQS